MISTLLTRYDTAHGYPNQDILEGSLKNFEF